MKNSWKWLLALAISCLSFACTLEPNEPADLEAQLLAEVADPIAEVEPMALEPTEPLAASPGRRDTDDPLLPGLALRVGAGGSLRDNDVGKVVGQDQVCCTLRAHSFHVSKARLGTLR